MFIAIFIMEYINIYILIIWERGTVWYRFWKCVNRTIIIIIIKSHFKIFCFCHIRSFSTFLTFVLRGIVCYFLYSSLSRFVLLDLCMRVRNESNWVSKQIYKAKPFVGRVLRSNIKNINVIFTWCEKYKRTMYFDILWFLFTCQFHLLYEYLLFMILFYPIYYLLHKFGKNNIPNGFI